MTTVSTKPNMGNVCDCDLCTTTVPTSSKYFSFEELKVVHFRMCNQNSMSSDIGKLCDTLVAENFRGDTAEQIKRDGNIILLLKFMRKSQKPLKTIS